jgi:hypothetical protein
MKSIQLEYNNQRNNFAASSCLRIAGIGWSRDISPYMPLTQVCKGHWKTNKCYIELDAYLVWLPANAATTKTAYYYYIFDGDHFENT